ncbi:MAG: flagellar M-ring protein FliF, partial [Hyphomicrobiales bacterium]|nr:flagellar M-ring protein FliF [Hyphomicrobiales bacterium]
GTTSFVQNINHVRAMEGELARTIRTIDRVSAARVHLVLPERELFRRERTEPSASIVLKVHGALESNQIRAVQHLVASAVEGLKPGRVSIVDETGRLLASGNDEDGIGAVASHIMERRTALERQMRAQIEDIVGQVVGPGRTRVQVAAELDFNRVTQTADVFDPESQVVRSTQSRAENSSSKDASGDNSVSVGNQLPGGGNSGNESATRDASSTEEETVNYEISRTTKTEVTEAGQIKRLSVAVLVDGIYNKDANGDIAYTPRSQEQIDQIAALVRSAIGFDQTRGDQVEVVNLQFAEGPPTDLAAAGSESFIELNKQDYLYFIELGVIALLTLIVLFFVVRPLLKRVLAPEEVKEIRTDRGDGAVPALTSEAGETARLPAPINDDGSHSQALDAAQAAGSVQANSISRVGSLVESHPTEAVAIVRAWLNEAA